MKKILICGGTGAMAVYLIPELLRMGYQVDAVALDAIASETSNLRYIRANAKERAFVEELLKGEYNAVVDFMVYKDKEEYEAFLPLYLENTDHYIFLSTYRVYADEEHPIKETSPRILDVTTDEFLLASGDYCIYKAQAEDFLAGSQYGNWTVIRPVITYSKRRFQLVTLEHDLVIRRMLEGKTLVLPEPAMNIQATMTWAGDVAKMISRLVLNPDSYRETYSVCTAEHHSWEEVAQIYQKLGNLKYCTTDTESFLNIIGPGNPHVRHQLIYDRYFHRIMDNSKILNITGLRQSDLMPLEKGLVKELAAFPKDIFWGESIGNIRMDQFLEGKNGTI